MEASVSAVEAKGCGCGFEHKGFDCGELELVPEEVGGCSCGVKFYKRDDESPEEWFQHDCPLDPDSQLGLAIIDEREPVATLVATLVPGRPGSVTLPPARHPPIIVVRDDGALMVHAPEPGPANCCDRRMVYVFVNRGGVTLCPTCDARRPVA